MAETSGSTQARDDQPSLGDLVGSATRDLSALLRAEVELAKAELSADAKKAGLGAGLFTVAGVLALFAGVFVSVAAAEALDIVLATWLSYLIIGVGYLLVAGSAALVGKGRISRVRPPRRTLQTVRDDIAWAKHPTSATPTSASGRSGSEAMPR